MVGIIFDYNLLLKVETYKIHVRVFEVRKDRSIQYKQLI